MIGPPIDARLPFRGGAGVIAGGRKSASVANRIQKSVSKRVVIK
jgi:hypothetical protein